MKRWSGLVLIALWAGGTAYPARLEMIYSPSGVKLKRSEKTSSEKTPSPTLPALEPMWLSVVAPWADVRATPTLPEARADVRAPYPPDDQQETQVLYGERVRGFEEKNGWVRIEAEEQPEYTHNNYWQGYPGWVPKAALVGVVLDQSPNVVISVPYAPIYSQPKGKPSEEWIPLGSRLFIILEKDGWGLFQSPDGRQGWVRSKDFYRQERLPRGDSRRRAILTTAKYFLKEPYYWGGRTPHRTWDRSVPSGVDCSGLVNLAYRANGVDIPRDAHEQYLMARPVASVQDLLPGDLLFLAKADKPDRMVHVMIYLGGDKVLEAVQEFQVVRQTTVKKKLGVPLSRMDLSKPISDRVVRLGRFLLD